jgi:acyl carrier protein
MDIKKTIDDFLIDEFELEPEQLVPDANLKDDLDIGSLDFVDIAVIVEKDFGFKVKSEDMVNIRVLQDLYDYIEEKTAN